MAVNITNSRCDVDLRLADISKLKNLLYYYENCVQMNDSVRDSFLKMVKEEIHALSHANQLDTWVLVILLIVYTLMTVFGAFGSGLVIHVVARNRQMRTPRNVFIVNLAISDLTLCLFTQPFNMMKILAGHQEWVLGDFMCKFVSMFQGTNVFVSTISITAIALDRFQVIVYPTRPNVKRLGAIVALLSIWTIALVMATPLLVFSKVSGDENMRLCGEHNNLDLIKNARFAYGVITMVFQYLVPLIITSIAYTRICLRIKRRMVNSRAHRDSKLTTTAVKSDFLQRKQQLERQRQRRTNILLLSISIVFALSWLPMNVTNIVLGIREMNFHRSDNQNITHDTSLSTQTVLLIQTICLLLVLCSACTNPILYGWLNENFRRQFQQTFSCSTPPLVEENNDEAFPKEANQEIIPMIICDEHKTSDNQEKELDNANYFCETSIMKVHILDE